MPPDAGRTIADLPEKIRAYLRVVGAFDLAPDLAIRIAETGEGAEMLGIHERKFRGAILDLSLLRVRFAARGLRAVEANS
jgi:hypothetical protein